MSRDSSNRTCHSFTPSPPFFEPGDAKSLATGKACVMSDQQLRQNELLIQIGPVRIEAVGRVAIFAAAFVVLGLFAAHYYGALW
jgi:hypothetical protein